MVVVVVDTVIVASRGFQILATSFVSGNTELYFTIVVVVVDAVFAPVVDASRGFQIGST